jgi:hypothetical protein
MWQAEQYFTLDVKKMANGINIQVAQHVKNPAKNATTIKT